MASISARMSGVAAAAGSGALLLGALAFQHLGGLFPCTMCLWQRWPHGVAILAGIAMLLAPARIWAFAGGAAALTTGAIGIYHTGVERGWWQGPSTCTSGDIGGMSTDDLFAQIMEAPVVRCDEVAWQMLGLSMASWNAVLSFALALVWAHAATRRA